MFPVGGNAQSVTGSNVVSTAVPFLAMSPESRGAAMGDAGVASSPDVNSQHWNPAKYAFAEEEEMALSLTFTPWMRSVIEDMALSYFSFFAHVSDNQTLSTSMRYFSYGSLLYYDTEGILQSYQNPNEFALDVAYATKLSREWSASVALRYIRSDMASTVVDGLEMSAANSYAADVAFFYQKSRRSGYRRHTKRFGMVVSNIGAPISYDDGRTRNFLPANLRVGGGYEMIVDRYNKWSFVLDFNKLLAPTSNYIQTTNSDGVIIYTDSSADFSSMEAIFRSFTDAPGGFKEELQEITTSLGVEYLYDDRFALRTGFFNENKNKGGRQYVTMGAGLNLDTFTFDLSYLYTLSTVSPLENTIRFTLSLDLGRWIK